MLAFNNCSLCNYMEGRRHQTMFSWIKAIVLSSLPKYLLAVTEVSSRLCSVPHCQHQNMTPLFYFVLASVFFMHQELAGFNPH